MTIARRLAAPPLLAFLVASRWIAPSRSLALKPLHTVRVCQNKDCRSRYPPTAAAGETLARTFRDLIPPSDDNQVAVEPSECLGQCGRGPNVAVECTGKSGEIHTKMYFGVADVQTAAAILEVACDYDVPPMLLAAADVMARAGKVTSLSKKVSLLTSAIDTLSADPVQSSSTALARALVLRADARLEAIPSDAGGGALDDARRAADLDPLYGRAWRVLADAREAAGDFEGAVRAVERWAEVDPSLMNKARGEIERLSSRI